MPAVPRSTAALPAPSIAATTRAIPQDTTSPSPLRPGQPPARSRRSPRRRHWEGWLRLRPLLTASLGLAWWGWVGPLRDYRRTSPVDVRKSATTPRRVAASALGAVLVLETAPLPPFRLTIPRLTGVFSQLDTLTQRLSESGGGAGGGAEAEKASTPASSLCAHSSLFPREDMAATRKIM